MKPETDTTALRLAYVVAATEEDRESRRVQAELLASKLPAIADELDALRASVIREGRMREFLIDVIADCKECSARLMDRIGRMRSRAEALREEAAEAERERCRQIAEERTH